MTINDIQRAYLAIFAAREAGQNASSEQMKAIACCIRNRVRQGWHDGDWMKVIEHADEVRANLPGPAVKLDTQDRNFQRLVRDIDDIYFSRCDWRKNPSGDPMPGMEEAIGAACYWAYVNQPFTSWFLDHVVHQPDSHPQRANMGLMFFYE